jgi:predicted nucleotidyltransferase
MLWMHPAIEQHRAEIDVICRRHGVKRLELFGSAARGKSDPGDFDFFVEFVDYSSPTIADQWFGLGEDLETLLGRKVDLTSARAVTNPYFLEVANRHRITLYAA